MKFSTIATLAAASFVSAEDVASLAAKKPRVTSNNLQKEITTKNLMGHLQNFDRIAFTQGNGNRAFGLPGYAASVDYVWNLISGIEGTKSWKQDFPAWFAQTTSISLKVDGKDVYAYGINYSPSTSSEGITAEVVAGPAGAAGCDAANYEGLGVEGKIVLVQRFRCPTGGTLAGRVRPAKAAGAAAVLIYSDVTTKPTAGSLGEVALERYAPAGFINLADGEAFLARLQANETLEATFQLTQVVEERITQNVFVETEAGDEKNTIVLGAHLDSVQAGPGINDDASGTSLLLEVFKGLQKYRHKNKVRFAWWGAEENGLLGSAYYVQSLKVEEVNNILAYLNFDMVSKGYYGVSDNDGRAHGSVAPKGSEVIQQIYLNYFASKKLETTPAILTNGSDYASFWTYLNKPFGFLNTGTGVAQDPCYHQACDTYSNPNKTVITNNAKAAAHQIAILAENGHDLIPKKIITASTNTARLASSMVLDIEEIQALGETQLGCGHDL